MQRIRFSYRRGEDLKYLSHLDLLRTLHRAFRRAKYPLLYRGQFNPQPRLDPGIPLPLGVTSAQEYGEVYLDQVEINSFLPGINCQLPRALEIRQASLVPLNDAALMEQINSAHYQVYWDEKADKVSPSEGNLNDALELIKNSTEITVLRQSKKKNKKKKKREKSWKAVNIRPYLYCLEIKPFSSGYLLEMLLQTGNRGGTSPLEIMTKIEEITGLSELKIIANVHRLGLFWYDGKSKHPPSPFRGKINSKSLAEK